MSSSQTYSPFRSVLLQGVATDDFTMPLLLVCVSSCRYLPFSYMANYLRQRAEWKTFPSVLSIKDNTASSRVNRPKYICCANI